MQNGVPALDGQSSRSLRGRLRSNAKTEVASMTRRVLRTNQVLPHILGGAAPAMLMLLRCTQEGSYREFRRSHSALGSVHLEVHRWLHRRTPTSSSNGVH
ncbi:unnamed protein product, partial [Symbiodinium sp. CCMP2456]